MANRFWVGGTGNWSDDDNHWATSSGGGPADGNVPTSSDDVIIDSSSGFGSGGTITIDASSYCKDLTCTSGHTFSITGSDYYLFVYGSLSLESGITFDGFFRFAATTTGHTVTSNSAVTSDGAFTFRGVGGGWTLQDTLNVSGAYNFTGTVDYNDQDVTAEEFEISTWDGDTTINMGSGTFKISSEFYIDSSPGYTINFDAESSTIELTAPATFDGADETFNKLLISSTNTSLSDSNTFSVLEIGEDAGVAIDSNSTQTATTFIVGDNATLSNSAISSTAYYGTTDAYTDLYSGGNTACGQSFEGNGHELQSIYVPLKRVGTPTGNYQLKIYAHSGTYGTSGVPTGPVLASSYEPSAQHLSTADTAVYSIGFKMKIE